MRRITLKDVATEVGLSVSCTARALKGRPGIPASTCERVRQAAERLGYCPDPMLTALSAYRQSQKPAKFQGTMAYITTRFDEKTALADLETGGLLRGARMRAESLGYRLEYFNIGEDKKNHQEAGKILLARGIRAAVIRSFPVALHELHLPLDKIASVDLFCEPHLEKFHTVSSNHVQAMELALQEVRKRGYQRPALAVRRALSEYLHHGWLMAFQVYAASFERPMTYLYPEPMTDFAAMARWAKKEKIDALLFGGSEEIAPKLRKEDTALCHNIGILSMDVHDPGCGVTGIYQDRFRGGAVAVEWLQTLLLTGQTGVTPTTNSLMIPGTWIPGTTLPFRSGR